MIIYILFVVFSILMTLIALGFVIGGLIKKKHKIWLSALAGFVVFIMLSVVSIFVYFKETIEYMGSVEFQSETKKKAENLGKTWGNTVSGTTQGLEATLDDDAIARLAYKGSKIVGKGIKAVTNGIDETLVKTTIFADESIEQAGIDIGRAEKIVGSKYSFGLFLEFKNAFNGKLVLTAYDSEGKKQDQSELITKVNAGDAGIYTFKFENFSSGLNGYCVLYVEVF